ncbi:MAG TPA: hypothetical protein VIZ18_05050 [Ktedonobacteraceae bacterium]
MLCSKWLLFDARRQYLAMMRRRMRERGMARVFASIGVSGKARLDL